MHARARAHTHTHSDEVQNVNIDRIRPIISPAVLAEELPATAAVCCGLATREGCLTLLAYHSRSLDHVPSLAAYHAHVRCTKLSEKDAPL